MDQHHRHHGRDIDGACGQLAVKVVAASAKSTGGGGGGDGCSSGANTGGDIEDLVPGGGSGRAPNGASRGRLGKAANGGGKTGGGRRTPTSLSSSSRGPEDTIEISVEGADGALDGKGRRGWAGPGRPLLGVLTIAAGAAAIATVAVVLVARTRRRG